MSELTIRRMRAEDAEAVAGLSAELGYQALPAEILQRLRLIEATPDNAAWVAQSDGKVLGWVHGRAVHSLEGGSCIEIGGLVVTAASRGQGVGKRLLAECEAWAQSRGYGRIRLRSSTPRVEAHAFYRHIGYQQVKTSHTFVLELPRR